ncbi:MAG: hypothetical protein K9M75_12900 [Phycisphaerae bacterium]|nr:hypothetical protein [Phycisphaerae bacterium]
MIVLCQLSGKHFWCNAARLSVLTLMVAFCTASMAVERSSLQTDVTFRTTDVELQRLFDAAQEKTRSNIVQFTPTMKVLVEGGGYGNAWIETQPMGGEMYAKRNLEVALNNQLVFMLCQRSDGRLPGMVISTDKATDMRAKETPEDMIWMPKAKILADFEMFQGYCFPTPAWKMYFWIGKDKDYLRKLYKALQAHDAYLWRTRDSNDDGILETWCVWDTGEDGSSRLNTRRAPYRWPFDFPPDPSKVKNPNRYWSGVPKPEQVMVPFASMDVMSYSYDGRNTLAKISKELGNGRAGFWESQAEDVRRRLIEGLWDPSRNACFDRDRNNKQLDELIHNNLRVMYHGTFTQSMADKFIKHHLLNPDEFWTPLPLPSIAVNDPLYRNHPGNDWSGQPQGLTWQRAIGALENYGHFAEVSLLGQKLIPVLINNDYKFSQQLDPQTGKDDAKRKRDGYGPMMLATMEYISRMYGIHLDVVNSRVWWSSLGDKDFTCTQKWGRQSWSMTSQKGKYTASLNGKELFSSTAGVRVVTDLEGKITEIVGINPTPQSIVLQQANARHQLTVRPNHVYRLADEKLIPLVAVPFDYPYHQGK